MGKGLLAVMQAARKCISGVVVISAVWWFDLFLGVEWIGIVFKGVLSGVFYFGCGFDS